MKRIIFFVLFMNVTVNAQIKIQPEVGFSGLASILSLYNTYKTNDFSSSEIHPKMYDAATDYFGLYTSVGSRISTQKISFSLNGQYQFIQNHGMGNLFLKSNLIGVNTSFRIFEQKKIRLFFQSSIVTEIASNYTNKYLLLQAYTPADYTNSVMSGEYIKTYLYKKTPFIWNAVVGCNVKVVTGLSLNFLIGYEMRMMKKQNAILDYTYSASHTKITSETKIGNPNNILFHMLNFQLGLNYTFSFKKKPKTETP